MTNRNILTRVLGWLRAGYPQGIPQQDFVALLEVLQRHLTADEVASVADELAAASSPDRPITAQDIREMVRSQVYLRATDSDIARVSGALAFGGWPLADELDTSVAESA